MRSMTGYGSGAAENGRLQVVVEIASLNRRNFEVSVSLPREWQALERMVSEKARKAAHPGRLQISVQIRDLPGEDEAAWDDEATAATLEHLKALANEQDLPFEADANLLFQVALQHRSDAEVPPVDEAEDAVAEALDGALGDLIRMRSEEGSALKDDLSERTGKLALLTAAILEESGSVLPSYREKLHDRLRQAGLEIDLEDERVLREIALFADRCDISEELTRLESHLSQLAETLDEDGAIGRKLEFILQEVNREFNTIGAKGNNLEISRNVIEAKNEMERIREQLQNVE